MAASFEIYSHIKTERGILMLLTCEAIKSSSIYRGING